MRALRGRPSISFLDTNKYPYLYDLASSKSLSDFFSEQRPSVVCYDSVPLPIALGLL